MNIVAGLFSFGVMTGLIAGLSVTAGAATGLMTGLFSFVGGAVLTYGGFRKAPLATKTASTVIAAITGEPAKQAGEESGAKSGKKDSEDPGLKPLVAAVLGRPEAEPQPLIDLKWESRRAAWLR